MQRDQIFYTRLPCVCVCVLVCNLNLQSKCGAWRKWACLGAEPLCSVALVAQQLSLKAIYILPSAPPTDSSVHTGSTEERQGGKWDVDLLPAVHFSTQGLATELETVNSDVDFQVK